MVVLASECAEVEAWLGSSYCTHQVQLGMSGVKAGVSGETQFG